MGEYRTIKDLNGKAIVSATTGQKIGSVSGVLLDPKALRVAALRTSGGTILKPQAELVRAGKVQVWGQDVILVSDGDAVTHDFDVPESENWVDAQDYTRGRSVVDMDGKRLGRVDDILLDAQGAVIGYDLGRVDVEGPLAQSKFIPVSATQSLGRDVLIVDLSKAAGEAQTGADRGAQAGNGPETPTGRETRILDQ